MFPTLLSPTILIDHDRLKRNIARMQACADAHGTELWPHIKTHKMIEVARMQLEAGAKGLTCAKIGEADAMLPSGARRIFLAHSIVDPNNGPRLRALAESLDELILACTSAAQAEALDRVLAPVSLTLPVMLAIDTGMGREGVRSLEEAVAAAQTIRELPHLRLHGLYAHEGQVNLVPREERADAIRQVRDLLVEARARIDPALVIWPGSSVSAMPMAALPGINAVRPGTYVFGDLATTQGTGMMEWDDLAATILATVVDRPQADLALIDAGSKVFSGDKLLDGRYGAAYDQRDLQVLRCNEEHGYVTGGQVGELRVCERLRFVPAHVCTMINLADEVTVIRGDQVVDTWRVAARGKVR